MMTTSLLAAGRSPLPRSSPLKERPHHEDNCSLLACCQVPEAPASSFRVTRLTGYGECAWDRTCARAPEGDAYTGIRSSIGDWKSWERALGTIKYAIDRWDRTLRLCLILFVAGVPPAVIGVIVSWHLGRLWFGNHTRPPRERPLVGRTEVASGVAVADPLESE